MRSVLSGCEALLVEFNHDLDLLMAGPYPMQLKRRVAGDRGHLSNKQAAALLAAIDCTRLQHLVLTHLSEINNTPEFARSAAAAALGCDPEWIACAHQREGLSWPGARGEELLLGEPTCPLSGWSACWPPWRRWRPGCAASTPSTSSWWTARPPTRRPWPACSAARRANSRGRTPRPS